MVNRRDLSLFGFLSLLTGLLKLLFDSVQVSNDELPIDATRHQDVWVTRRELQDSDFQRRIQNGFSCGVSFFVVEDEDAAGNPFALPLDSVFEIKILNDRESNLGF